MENIRSVLNLSMTSTFPVAFNSLESFCKQIRQFTIISLTSAFEFPVEYIISLFFRYVIELENIRSVLNLSMTSTFPVAFNSLESFCKQIRQR